MLWVVHEAVYEVGKGEEEGEVTTGIRGLPCEECTLMITIEMKKMAMLREAIL